MSPPNPSHNVSFQESVPPSRRTHQNSPLPPINTGAQTPPRPSPKSGPSKASFNSNASQAPASPLNYGAGPGDDYIDVQNQGFSASNGVAGGDFRRKKSMVRPDRERIDPNHRLWHYREHAADGERGGLGVLPSTTGNQPNNSTRGPGLRRGKSLLAREPSDTAQESGLHLFKRGATLRRKASQATPRQAPNATQTNRAGAGAVKDHPDEKLGCLGNFAPGPKDAWMVYCYLLTICVPGFVLRGVFGKKTPEAQRAWREKMGIVGIVAVLMAAVGFITFGFTQTVCGDQALRIRGGEANNGSLVINGYAYDFSRFEHPAILPYFNGTTNPLYSDEWQAGGKDASFLFQNVNQKCKGIITPAAGSAIISSGDNMAWYFPCNLHDQNGTSAINITGYELDTNCHRTAKARSSFGAERPAGQVYYTWDMVKNPQRNLAVYKSNVLDLDLLQWLEPTQVQYPAFFDTVKNGNETYQNRDITMLMTRSGMDDIAACLSDVVRIGFIDSKSIGCVASDVVLYLSLIFIIGVVVIKFGMAVIFGWFLSWRLGNFKGESYNQRMARAAEIENWTDDIYRPAPGRYRPNVAAGKAGNTSSRKTAFFPSTSRFSKADPMIVASSRPSTAYGMPAGADRRKNTPSLYGVGNKLAPGHTTPPGSPMLRSSRSSTSLPFGRDESRMSLSDAGGSQQGNCPFPLHNVIPQPAPDFEPFNFPLLHSICLVTAYSESVEGLRTTLDSLATTDYPNSHKLILVIADGMVRGSGSKLHTPDIVLTMMKELIVPMDEVEAHSYVAIADGHKRHNMAKVYAGFYDYDSSTVESSKQQRVPIVLVAKVGNPLEVHDAKPGNRGKRDSQIILMSFLQKVMFDERMTTLEYEFFNAIWRVTGISPDRYETVLCVDADTKVFPDSLTRMNACMVNDPEIMGLCGETKIANKSETWVTMIQVFEYYISHHLTKAFESMFGGVTCLPGCFSMYRIKAPKGDQGYWVPILANPDICEHYSENVVDTLHKKNLLLLGEDRFLSTLMLKTFPKRKMVFCPQAVCKTVVPDTFRILLSQRRRWINSTIHNLFELMLVRDLCGTFCFSMQFVVFMDLAGTLVLPAAISFTLYIVIIAIIPSQPTPTVSLILLAFILGLPGLLIVITSRKAVYVGWMLMYLISLPVWNLVLPAYAFWHMDDFSWGETRKVQGEGKEAAHGDKDGVFDSSHIVMKRWVEYERERRWRNGTSSRDSYYDVIQRSSSPKSSVNPNRYSVVSNDTLFSGSGNGNSTENGPLYRQSQSFSSMTNPSSTQYESSSPLGTYNYGPQRVDSGVTPLLDAPRTTHYTSNRDASPGSTESEGSGSRGPMMTRGLSDDPSSSYHGAYPAYSGENFEGEPILAPAMSPEQTYHSTGFSDDDDSRLGHSRGVSLVDPGYTPAAAPTAVRRASSKPIQTSRSRSNNVDVGYQPSLPPGARF